MKYGTVAQENLRRGISLLLFAAATCCAPPTQAAQEYALKCEDCHTMPPLDSAAGRREAASGAFKGNHQTHADARAVSCARCHGPNVVNYLTGHRDKTIQVQGNINNSPKVATYSRAFANQTSVPPGVLGTCSSVNCHFESATPPWGSGTYQATADCGSCHSAAPTSYAHSAHFATFGSGFPVCAKCHPDYATSAAPFAHATSAGKRVIAVKFSTGSYTGGNTSFLPSQSAIRTIGSCSSIYCHSRGQNGTGGVLGSGDYVSASWSTPASGACGTCHATTALATGSHAKHLAIDGNCGTCHANASATSYRFASHADGQVDVSGQYSAGGAPGNGFGSCAAATCHVSPYGTGSVASPVWGTTGGCASCHNGTGAFGASGAPATGSHAKHMALTGAACNQCHAGAASGTSGGATHTNGTVEVTNGYTASPVAKHAIGTYNGSCTNTSCHNNGTGIYTGIATASSTPVWGASGGCGACHGNSSYTDYRKGAPLYLSGTPKRNAHDVHLQAGPLSGHDVECKFCHAATVNATNDAATSPPHADGSYTLSAGGATYTFEDGDNITAAHGAKVATSFSYLYQDAGHGNDATCSNVSCHPTGLAGSKSASKTAWNNRADCTDCHKVNLQNATGYHHAMRNYSAGNAGYPSAVPGISAGANDNSRRCTMCHVDHTVFSPDLNTGNALGAAANLRSGIAVPVTKSSGYLNSDFSAAGGGICISCHGTELFKDTGNVRVKNETGSTKTASVTLKGYSSSAHEYAVASAMRRDGKSFSSNCSKCHNGRVGELAAFSSLTTAVHDSPVRRLYATLGQQGADGSDAGFCYRCHSRQSDAVGGTKKPLAGKDYYAAATMSAAAEDIFSTVAGTPANPGTPVSGNVLYFRNSAAGGTVPGGWLLASGSYSPTAPAINTRQYDMTPGSAGAAQSSVADNISSTTVPRYAHKVQFISPPVTTGFTWGSGSSFTLKINVQGPTGVATTYTRYAVYQWTSAGAAGTTVRSAANGTYLWTTASATDTIPFTSSSAVTFNAGDRIVVEVEVYRNSAITGNYTVFWNGAEGASLTLPSSQGFSIGATPAVTPKGHLDNAAYAGVHKSSPADETFAYISANKHVSCNDCHDPHEAKGGNHVKGSGVLANVLRGATGVSTPTWPAIWTAPAQSAYGSAPVNASAEWQVCFKCHSGANSNVTTWGGTGSYSFTDVGLEFNPNNKSYHPVIQTLPSTGNGRLAAGALTGGWTPGMLMTCTDCHATDSTASKGPHGSGVKWMLTGTNKAWPYNSSALNGTSGTTGFITGTGSSTAPSAAGGVFCLNCHTWSGGGAAHTQQGSTHGVACVACHIRVPHGGKVSRLLVTDALPTTGTYARYWANGQGGAGSAGSSGKPVLTSITKPASGTIGENNCQTNCGHHSNVNSEKW